MKLKKVIAAVSAAAMVIGCMPNVWAESADVPEEGVSVLPADYEPVTYNVANMSKDGFHIVNPYVKGDAVAEAVELPEKTKDISVCFDVDNCDATFSAWCTFAGNGWGTHGLDVESYYKMIGDFPEFTFNQSGSYELIIPVGLFLEAAKEDEDEENDFDYLEKLIVINMIFDGMVEDSNEDSNATVTITDVKAYQKSHTIEECVSAFKVSSPEPDNPDKPDDESDGFQYKENSDGTLTITKYKGEEKNIVVPSEINGKKVIAIGNRAFSDCTFITSVKIPDSVNEVNYLAFFGCTSLKEINIDENNAKYSSAEGILFNKDKTELLCYPAGKTEKKYSIPESVTSIGDYAFSNCASITFMKIPDSVTIGWYVFSGCSSLILVEMPDSVKFAEFVFEPGVVMMAGMFGGCSSLTTAVIPDTVTWIRSDTFIGCNSLTSVVIPKSVTKIAPEKGQAFAFKDSPNVTIYGYTDSYAEKYAAEYKVPFISIDDTANLQMNNGVEVSVPDNSEATLKDKTLETELQDSDENSATFNITLRDKDGKEVQPGGEITVKVPVPSYLKGEECNVYRKEADGTYTNMKAKFENGYMIFTTNHFSEYVLTDKTLSSDDPDVTTTTESTTASNDENKPTGFAIAIVPVIAATAAAAVFGKKRR